MSTIRNGIDTTNVMPNEVEILDSLYEICDAEFTSRIDIQTSFHQSRGQAAWANQLVWEVQKVARREGFQCSQFSAKKVADQIADDWFRED